MLHVIKVSKEAIKTGQIADPLAGCGQDLSGRWCILFLFVCVAILIFPILQNLRNLPTTATGGADSVLSLSHIYVIADAIRNFGEYPLWNPYFGGGIPWAGAVYNPGLSPVSLFYIASGEIVGIKLWIFAVMFLGSYGMYATVREWIGLKPSSALVGSLSYVGCAWLPGVLYDGDFDKIGYFMIPFVALCLLRLLQRRWLGLLLPVCYMTLFAEAAKIIPFLVAVTVLAFAIAHRAQSGRTLGAVAGMWALGFGVGLLLAAPKLIPTWYLINMDLVDQVASREWICYAGLTTVLNYVVFPGENQNIQVGAGIAGSFFAACGFLMDWKRSFGLLGILGAAVIVGLCQNSPIPVVKFMSAIPVLNKVGSYGMYASLVILFCICGLAAIGFERFRKLFPLICIKGKKRKVTLANKLIIGFVAVSFIYTARYAVRVYGEAFETPDFSAARETFYQVSDQALSGVIDRYRQTPEDHLLANQYYNIRRGVGTITWYGNMVFPEYAQPKVVIDANGTPVLQKGYLGEAYCAGDLDNGCKVIGLDLTYNTIRLHMNADKPSTVILNFNYNPGWRASDGEVTRHEGLLAVRVPGGSNGEVVLRFSDFHFTVGLVLAFIMAALWSIGGVVWVRRNHGCIV